MELSPEEILANFRFKRPDLRDFSLQQVQRLICVYNSFMNGEERIYFKGLLHDLAYLQLNDDFFKVANLDYEQFIHLATGSLFVFFCSVNIEIAKFVAERFKISNHMLLIGSLRVPRDENESIHMLIDQVKNLERVPSEFLYESLRERHFYQLMLVSEKVKRCSFSYTSLLECLSITTPTNILKIVLLKYADLASDLVLQKLLNLEKFSLAKFYIEFSNKNRTTRYQPNLPMFTACSHEIHEMYIAFSLSKFDSFYQTDKIIFLYNLEIAKTCICLKALPPVLIQLILEFARPLASVIIPYLAKVYHPNKPMQTRSKRVKRELKGLLG